MAFSYSFHLSAKSHAVTSVGKVGQVEKHNLRKYKSEKYDRSQIVTIRGTDSLLDDVKKVYHEEFDECLERYNQGKREDRKIKNYLEHVSNSRSDVAAEIIIQVGDKDFWKDIPKEDQRAMVYIFKDQIKTLEQILPGFKIANATIHFDESSPHMHVVGVPVADGYVKGMEKQVAKTKVFTKESLTKCQDVLRKHAEIGINLNHKLFGDVQLKEKEKGRNRDIPKYAMDDWTEIQAEIKDGTRELEQLEKSTNEAQEVLKNTEYAITSLTADKQDIENKIDTLSALTKIFEGNKEEANRRLQQTRGLLTKTYEDLLQVQREKLELENKISSLEDEKSQAEDSLEDIKKEQVQVQSHLDKIKDVVSTFTENKAGIELEVERLERDKSDASEDLQKALNSLQRTKDEQIATQYRIRELKGEVEVLENRKSLLKKNTDPVMNAWAKKLVEIARIPKMPDFTEIKVEPISKDRFKKIPFKDAYEVPAGDLDTLLKNTSALQRIHSFIEVSVSRIQDFVNRKIKELDEMLHNLGTAFTDEKFEHYKTKSKLEEYQNLEEKYPERFKQMREEQHKERSISRNSGLRR